MKRLITVEGRPGKLEFVRQNGVYSFQYGAEPACEASLLAVEPGVYSLLLKGRSYEVKVAAATDGYLVDFDGRRSVVRVVDPRSLPAGPRRGSGEGRQSVCAPMPGKVVRILVKEGDVVEAGAGLVVVEAMKMQNELKAPKAGTILQLNAKIGTNVKNGEMLAVIE